MFNYIHKRMHIVKSAFIIYLVIVLLRVLFIETVSNNELKELANNLWSRNLPVESERGRILDRNGVVLAENITTNSLVIVPNQVKNKEQVASDLAHILNVSYEEMYKHVSKKTSIERVHPEGRKLSEEVTKQIKDLNHDGIYLMREFERYYPFDYHLSHVLGFVGIDNQGLSGLELYYNDYLTGKKGSVQYISNAKGSRISLNETYQQPANGIDIMLTIDYEIQAVIERELTNAILQYNPDRALAIAMDPNTGEILGMASRPTFSPNNYQDSTPEVINRNLPIWGTFEPGSTFKIVTLTAALQEGLVNLEEDKFYDPGYIMVEGARIKCWKHGGHKDQTYLEVVENSCNPGFVSMGMRVGKEKLFEYIDAFGFGEKTGIDLNGEENGIIFKLENVGPVEHATTSFGQGISVTPLQQVRAVSAVINGGYLYEPYVAKMFLEPSTNALIKENKPTLINRVIDEETSAEVRYALESVVARGTGRNAYIDGYRVGGKTGTAQKVKDGVYMEGNYILSFIGFAPADDPQIVVYVAIDNPKGVIQYGGVVAAPIAGRILRDSLEVLGVEKREGQIKKEYNWFDPKYYDMPLVEGLKVAEAMENLTRFQVIFSGSGDTVIKQSPEFGERVKEGGIVRLLVGNN